MIFERLEYELVYTCDFARGADLYPALDHYFRFLSYHRPHQALGHRTPAEPLPQGVNREKAVP